MNNITNLQDVIVNVKNRATNEEQTKMYLISPFIQYLGYNIFNPDDVVPEFIADVGSKKGEKVDYALMVNNEPYILLEAKTVGTNLDNYEGQLFRYYTTVEAQIAILTDGVNYRFYADTEKTNILDDKPFFSVNLEDITEEEAKVIQLFSKNNFNLEEALDSSAKLHISTNIHNVLNQIFKSPDDDFMAFMYKRVAPNSRYTKPEQERFKPIVADALEAWREEEIQNRLKAAMENKNTLNEVEIEVDSEVEPVIKNLEPIEDNGIITTEHEIAVLEMLRHIASEIIEPERIFMKDSKSYCNYVLDDSSRNSIIRLKTRSICFYAENENKSPVYWNDSHPLKSAEELSEYKDLILESIRLRLD